MHPIITLACAVIVSFHINSYFMLKIFSINRPCRHLRGLVLFAKSWKSHKDHFGKLIL